MAEMHNAVKSKKHPPRFLQLPPTSSNNNSSNEANPSEFKSLFGREDASHDGRS